MNHPKNVNKINEIDITTYLQPYTLHFISYSRARNIGSVAFILLRYCKQMFFQQSAAAVDPKPVLGPAISAK